MAGYISEVDYDGGAGSNFVEIVVPAGVDTSGYSLVVYDNDGTIIETFSLGAPVNTIAGKNVYLLDDNTPDWVDVHNNEALALVDGNGDVLQFIAFKDPVTAVEGPADGMSATQVGEHSGGDKSLQSFDGGASYQTTETSDPGVVPCYAPGTLIDTPHGPRRIEALRAGDAVLSLDRGAVPVLWASARDVDLRGDGDNDDAPVLIRAGAFGPGCPERDLVVSPQHRLLAGGRGLFVPGLAQEVLVPAKALTRLPGVRRMSGKRQITWHHLACAPHAVIRANGCPGESLLLGPMVLNALPRRDRKRVGWLFRDADRDGVLNGPPARPILSVREGRALVGDAAAARLAA